MTIKAAVEVTIGSGIDPIAWALSCVAFSVGLLAVLIAWLRLLPLVAFVLVSIIAALLLGLPHSAIPASIDKGIGDLLGSLTVVVCLGGMLGKLIAESGAARTIAESMIATCGPKHLLVALTVTGMVVGIPLFYTVGFVVLVPLLASVIAVSGRPPIVLAVTLLSGLSIAHGFLPPHPAPTALIVQFNASMGMTLVYGLAVGIPTLIIAGPIFARTLRGISPGTTRLFVSEAPSNERPPSTFASFACALLPIVLLGSATAVNALPIASVPLQVVSLLLGNATVVLLLSLANAWWFLGRRRGLDSKATAQIFERAVRDVAPILLVIAGAGALKQVLQDSGFSQQLGVWLRSLPISPLLLGWSIAALIRICVGSATVAGVTAAGLLVPIVKGASVNPNLMVLAIGAGSLMCSHVNDSGFWMFKEYFNLSLRDTLRSWTVMETVIGICGIVFVSILSIWV